MHKFISRKASRLNKPRELQYGWKRSKGIGCKKRARETHLHHTEHPQGELQEKGEARQQETTRGGCKRGRLAVGWGPHRAL